MSKVSINQVLGAVYRYGADGQKTGEFPLSFGEFRKIMLSTETCVERMTIKAKWTMICSAGYTRPTIYTDKVIVSIDRVYAQLVAAKVIVPDDDEADGQKCARVCVRVHESGVGA